MPRYNYSAQDEKGKMNEGHVDAADEMAAIAQIQRQGMLVLEIHEDKMTLSAVKEAKQNVSATPVDKKPELEPKKAFKFDIFMSGPPAADMIFLAEQLALLLRGGVPLLRGLKIISQNITHPDLRKTLEKVSDDIAGGASFHGALSKHPKIFSDVWLSLVEAGEAGGRLPETLNEISSYFNQRDALRAKIITAFMYPSILVILSICVIFFFLVKVIPVFKAVFEGFNLKLPALTMVVMQMSNLLTSHIVGVMFFMVAVAVGASSFLKTESGKWFKSRRLLTMPILGKFISNIYIEMFLTNFAMLLKSGVDVLRALEIIERLLSGNKEYQYAVTVAIASIKEGSTISQAFARSKIFPDLPKQMMAMGEESGNLPEVMLTLSQFYRRQIDTFILRLSSVIDPIMVVGIGSVVGVIVLAMFMPIFELSSIGMGGK